MDNREGCNKPRMKSSILIVDDHPMLRHGLTQLLNGEADLEVLGEAGTADEALEALRKSRFDLIITDLSLSGVSGIELVRNIHARDAALPVLVISMYDETVYAERALRAGARGYIMKQEATEKVLSAVRRLLAGDVYLSDALQAKMLRRAVGRRGDAPVLPVEVLSDRELEVLRLMGRGLGTRQIAEELRRSIKTMEAHRASLKDKLGLKTAAELAHFAAKWFNEG